MAAASTFSPAAEAERRAWSAGDYSAVGHKLVVAAELLVEAVDPAAGARVLDVAAGTGNAALAAARAGCRVTALDFAPALLERARARAEAEGVAIDVVEADAEHLPFPAASFDAVVSVFGVMFAPEQERAAAELARVCVPGGRIGLANWVPDSFAAWFFQAIGDYAPPPPDDAPSPMRWGTEEGVRELLGDAVVDLETRRRTLRLRYPSPEAFAELYLTTFGPAIAIAAELDDDGRAAMHADLEQLARTRSERTDAVTIPADYLEVAATRA